MPPSSNAGPFVRRQRRESLLGGKPRRADLRAVFTGFEEGWPRSLYDGRAELRVRCPNSALRYAIYRRRLPALLNTATCSISIRETRRQRDSGGINWRRLRRRSLRPSSASSYLYPLLSSMTPSHLTQGKICSRQHRFALDLAHVRHPVEAELMERSRYLPSDVTADFGRS